MEKKEFKQLNCAEITILKFVLIDSKVSNTGVGKVFCFFVLITVLPNNVQPMEHRVKGVFVTVEFVPVVDSVPIEVL